MNASTARTNEIPLITGMTFLDFDDSGVGDITLYYPDEDSEDHADELDPFLQPTGIN